MWKNTSFKYFKKKISSKYIIAKDIVEKDLLQIDNYDCIIIDNYEENIKEKFLYSALNHYKQLNKCIVINTIKPIQKLNINLIDLKSRFKSFIQIGIDFPTDDLLKVIISKSFSDKQIDLNTRNLEYILKNIDRSYDKVFEFIKDLDEKSLSTGKSININLIKKVLNK